MNAYERWILPYLLDLAMRQREVARYRAKVVPLARGEVLEVGVGSGLNFPYYGAQVERVRAVDPSQELLRMARPRAALARFPVALEARAAESLPIEDGVFDAVVMTFTLCSVAEPERALREMRRVLKPGGELLFAEHGLAPEASVQRWQRRLNPLWRPLAGGCNLDRDVLRLLQEAGFRLLDVSSEYARAPRFVGYVSCGSARPA